MTAGSQAIRLFVASVDGGRFYKSPTVQSVVEMDGIPLGNAVFTGPLLHDAWFNVTVDVPAELLATKRIAKVTVTTPDIGTSSAVDFPIE